MSTPAILRALDVLESKLREDEQTLRAFTIEVEAAPLAEDIRALWRDVLMRSARLLDLGRSARELALRNDPQLGALVVKVRQEKQAILRDVEIVKAATRATRGKA